MYDVLRTLREEQELYAYPYHPNRGTEVPPMGVPVVSDRYREGPTRAWHTAQLRVDEQVLYPKTTINRCLADRYDRISYTTHQDRADGVGTYLLELRCLARGRTHLAKGTQGPLVLFAGNAEQA